MSKKKLLTTFVLSLTLLTNSSFVYAQNEKETNPINKISLENINKKEHFNELIKNKSDMDSYLKNLAAEDLLLTIAESADEFTKLKSTSELSIFVPYTDKLIDELSTDDYVYILNNKDYTEAFKQFMMDFVQYSKKENKLEKLNTRKYNQQLRKMVKDTENEPMTQVKALLQIDDFEQKDMELLDDILSSNSYADEVKGHALKVITKLDKDFANEKIQDILDDPKEYSKFELRVAMDLLDTINDDSPDSVARINKILENTLSQETLEDIIWSLGKIKNQESVETVIKNKVLFDEHLLKLYVNMNYVTIDKMLDVDNDPSIINMALECIEILPLSDFSKKLEVLLIKTQNKDIQERATVLLEKVKIFDKTRNTHWDHY